MTQQKDASMQPASDTRQLGCVCASASVSAAPSASAAASDPAVSDAGSDSDSDSRTHSLLAWRWVTSLCVCLFLSVSLCSVAQVSCAWLGAWRTVLTHFSNRHPSFPVPTRSLGHAPLSLSLQRDTEADRQREEESRAHTAAGVDFELSAELTTYGRRCGTCSLPTHYYRLSPSLPPSLLCVPRACGRVCVGA